MTFDPTTNQFNKSKSKEPKPEDLFLPSVVEIIRHIARIAAEQDYKHFCETGEIPYANSNPTEDGDD